MARDQASIEGHPFALRLRQFSPDLDFGTISKLFDAAVEVFSIKPRRDIFVQGFKNADCYIVERGFAMRYCLLHDGRRQVLSIAVPGDIVGLGVMFLSVSPKSVCSLSEMQVQRLHIDNFLAIASNHPTLSIATMRYLAYQIGLHYDRLIEIGRQSPVERVAHFLLRLHARLQTVGGASQTAFDMPLSQEVVGDLLGLSAPHVNRMLHRLRSDGLISMRRRHIELMDIEGLRRLSDFAPAGIGPIPLQTAGDGAGLGQQRAEPPA